MNLLSKQLLLIFCLASFTEIAMSDDLCYEELPKEWAIDLSDNDNLDARESEIRKKIQNTISIVAPIYDSKVRSYLRTYIEKYPEKTNAMLGRTTLYFPLFEKLLRENDMPEDLKYLAVVESSLRTVATSRVGAGGLWQFMRPTGREYGLKITKYIDERMDPEKSTRAAIKYLKYLYRRFGNWELVMAAYNAGPGRVNSAIRKSGSRDYWKLAKFLPRETRSYVPGFIAASYLCNYYSDHGLEIDYPDADWSVVSSVRVYEGISFANISEITGAAYDLIREMNAKFCRNYIPQSSIGYDVMLPDYATEYLRQYFQSPDHGVVSYKNFTPITTIAGARYEEREVFRTYRVRSGDNLYNLSRENDCSVTDLQNWNGLKSSNLSIGQPLKFYYTERVLIKPPARYALVTRPLSKAIGVYQTGRMDGPRIIPIPDLAPYTYRKKSLNDFVMKRRFGLRTQLQIKGILDTQTVMEDNEITMNSRVQPGKMISIDSPE